MVAVAGGAPVQGNARSLGRPKKVDRVENRKFPFKYFVDHETPLHPNLALLAFRHEKGRPSSIHITEGIQWY